MLPVRGGVPGGQLIALGADEGINYATEDLRERIKALTGGRNYGTSQLNHVLAMRQPGAEHVQHNLAAYDNLRRLSPEARSRAIRALVTNAGGARSS